MNWAFTSSSMMIWLICSRSGASGVRCSSPARFQLLRIDRSFHQVAGPQHAQAFEVASTSLVRNLLRDVQPGTRRSRARPDQTPDEWCCPDKSGNRRRPWPVSRPTTALAPPLRPNRRRRCTPCNAPVDEYATKLPDDRASQSCSAFETDRAVAQRCTFRAASHDADVLGHRNVCPVKGAGLRPASGG